MRDPKSDRPTFKSYLLNLVPNSTSSKALFLHINYVITEHIKVTVVLRNRKHFI